MDLKTKQDLSLLITKKCETLIHQTRTRPGKTLEFKFTTSRETFHFNPPVEVKQNWMIRLISLEVYNSVYNITPENNKFELSTGYLEDEFSYTQLKEKVAEILGLPNITPEELKYETFGPKFFEVYRKL